MSALRSEPEAGVSALDIVGVSLGSTGVPQEAQKRLPSGIVFEHAKQCMVKWRVVYHAGTILKNAEPC